MTRLSYILIAVVAVLMISCGRQAAVHWKDGNFEVYALDTDFNATSLGYNFHPGTLGLVEEQVMAAGSTTQFVFVERLNKSTGSKEFYVVQKEQSKDPQPGKVEGPFSEAQFREIRNSRQLPDFSWRKK